jgi:hypothetical protein
VARFRPRRAQTEIDKRLLFLSFKEVIITEMSTRVEKFENHTLPTYVAPWKLVALKKNQIPYSRMIVIVEHPVEARLLYKLSRPECL